LYLAKPYLLSITGKKLSLLYEDKKKNRHLVARELLAISAKYRLIRCSHRPFDFNLVEFILNMQLKSKKYMKPTDRASPVSGEGW
jgi:hypothetical protein